MVVMALLREMKELIIGPPPGRGEVIQELEHAMRTKGGMTKEEEKNLRAYALLPATSFVLASGVGSFMLWFGAGIGAKLFKLPPPMTGLAKFGVVTGCAYLMGNVMYHGTLRAIPSVLLNNENGRMKMELANIILTKHSDDEYLVRAVKRHFFSEDLYDDFHQDRPLFRWHPRRSYIDSAFLERVKEIESSNTANQARSSSRQTTVNIRSFGDLMEDPLACILGSPGGDMESNNPPENSGTVLKRSELRARRRSHRHHHRHADKLAS